MEPADPDHGPQEAEVDAAPRRGPFLGVPGPLVTAVAAGGAVGASARYGLSKVIHSPAGGFPWATFVINVSGSLLLGVLLTLVAERWGPTRFIRSFAGTGFCGAYTTWSTFMVDAGLLVRGGHVMVAATYVLASLLAGFGAVYLGIVLGRLWPASERRS
ncbi:MAG: CrcB family protein [Actinobacteria bacterium]|nr:CrcB family protein [Actinomycetota bacterium]